MNGIVIEKNEDIIDQDFNSLAWVLKARSKDKRRRNLFGIYSIGEPENGRTNLTAGDHDR